MIMSGAARMGPTTTKIKAAHVQLCHSRMFVVQVTPSPFQTL